MLSFCRFLLYLYPPAHRLEYGEEMVAVLRERQAESWNSGVLARWVFNLTVAVHVGEAFYSTTLCQRAGLDRNQWFWRTLFLGYFSIRKLQTMAGGAATPPRQ